MSSTTYILDSALVLLVLLQIKERPFTNRTIIRPLVILSIAVVSYLHGIPTSGNDLVLVASLGAVGAVIGAASGLTLFMRVNADGVFVCRAGWGSACFWVLGMGSRFAFAWWAAHGGVHSIASFSAQHSITGSEAWTVALLAMAVFEVLSRMLVMLARRRQLVGGTSTWRTVGAATE